ncbi:hypothetical protein GCM10018980_37950 [Streptomyces capoamus]|uniref:Uncharacterized protein n=1 Tax=Streptomyces capoamus TaxID=68183 RepID=A0A919C7W0_9ACTN|nr:hypothetical protein [Streptomyces capoamus]GHG53725.1 hypothetical protein GCM10018980_37950 [Streptomyces capoamus]
MGMTTGRRRAAIGAVLALLAGAGAVAASASPAAAATGDVLIVQKGGTGNLVSVQTFAFLPGITEQGDGVQAGATQFAVTNLTNRTLTLTERTASGTVVHSDTVAAGKNGTFAVTGGDTVALTVPAD